MPLRLGWSTWLAFPTGPWEFHWLIERPVEGETHPVYPCALAPHRSGDGDVYWSGKGWTPDPWQAKRFVTEAEATRAIREYLHPFIPTVVGAKAVSHGFGVAPDFTERSIEGGAMLEYRRPNGLTNYEDVVSQEIRDHTADLMRDWREDGRDDERIEDVVKSCVLAAYASGRDAGLREVYDFTKDRVRGG